MIRYLLRLLGLRPPPRRRLVRVLYVEGPAERIRVLAAAGVRVELRRGRTGR